MSGRRVWPGGVIGYTRGVGHSEFPPLLTLCAAYVGLAAILVPVSWGPWVCLAIMAPGVLGALYLGACYVWWHWRRPPG